ncbi:MAG: hypothetical protein IK127_01635 [Clostridia bacterium]|nr:hypothetical protein [Clostridia bacterium]
MSEPNAWAQYMENTRRTEELQSDILRGAKAGEDPAKLLILCAKALSLTTNNPVFAQEVERTMMAVQGHALGNPALREEELEACRCRLERIREAFAKEEDLSLKEEMEQAIRWHEKRIKELEAN